MDISMGIISILMQGNPFPIFVEDTGQIGGTKNTKKEGVRQNHVEDQKVLGTRQNAWAQE